MSSQKLQKLVKEINCIQLEDFEIMMLYSRHYSNGYWWEENIDGIVKESDESRREVISKFLKCVDCVSLTY
jgi:hypothetical protein